MTIMADVGSGETACVMAAEVEKCGVEGGGAAPRGERLNSPREDQLTDRPKKRRRKAKRKVPYPSDNKGKVIRYVSNKRRYKQPEAPYNSNRFLIEDHNDLKDLDVGLQAAARRLNGDVLQRSPQRGRARDSSFTSVESDDDYYYSSPEDEEEFLSKEFSNTYKDLHVETLASLSKSELIQHILSLEERMDTTQKKLEALSRTNPDSTSDYFQEEISKLVVANRTLHKENELLRRQRDASCTSSEDSESDSSSSTSCSSTSDSESSQQDSNLQPDEPPRDAHDKT